MTQEVLVHLVFDPFRIYAGEGQRVAGLAQELAAFRVVGDLPGADLIKMLKRQSAAGMNPTMAAIMGLFQIVWVYYGFLIDSKPVIVWNVVAVGINGMAVGAYFYFARRQSTV